MIACFEPLEQRQLLAANILASADATLSVAGETDHIQLEVAGARAILGLRMAATSGTLDPDAVAVADLAAHTIAPKMALADTGGATDSLVLAELGAGSYTVTTRAEGATTGGYQLVAYLPGDTNTDGLVDQNELLYARAAVLQAMDCWNEITQAYYAKHGIDLTEDLYLKELDCDADGRIGSFDLNVVTTNAAAGQVTITLVSDSVAPVIAAGLADDTGQSATDGVTNDATITGTVQDENQVVELLAAVDGAAYVSILAKVDASGNFQLDLAELEALAGGSLSNNGAHTLSLIATDEYDNESAPYEVTFELDTIAPAAPTGLDLVANSDLGFFDDDNITADNTPTITADAPSGSLVTLYSDLDGKVGEATASSPVSITAAALAHGVHQLTATATDVAGNESAASAALAVTIDTVWPAKPTLDLAVADDTGTVGDQMTEATSVRLEGVTEAGARVFLNAFTTTDADATTGAFGFDGTNLVFGANDYTVVAMDLAGNVDYFTQTFYQNNPPTLDTAIGPFELAEDPGTKSYSLATLFGDVNLTSGDVLSLSVVGNTNAALVTPTLSGTLGQIENSELQLVFGANQHGTATLTIRATDLYGETIDTTIVVNVTAVNDAPVAQVGNLSTDEDTALSVDLWTLVADVETPDADLTFTIASPTGGVAVLQADGHTVVFTPTPNYHGAAGFTYSVTDTGDDGSPAINVGPTAVNITVDPVNDTPAAIGTTLVTNEDTAVDVDLRTLVTDLETADDALIFSVAGASHGTVTLLTDGHTARFTPAANYNGAASFTYDVTDTGDGGSAAKTVGPTTINVTVNPVNDAPVAQVGNFSTNEDTALSVDLWTLVADVETPDASLTFSVASPSGGTAVLQADGHTVLFTPTGNYHGAAGFTYNVTDTGDGGSAAIMVGPTVVNITVDPVNDTPVASGTTLVTDEDVVVEVDLRTLVTDVETADDALIFSVGGASHGAVTLLGDGHTARFMPTANYNGAASFTYNVTDTGDGTAPATTVGPTTINVTVNPVNDAPVGVADTYYAQVNGTLNVDAASGVLANDTDVEGTPLTATLGTTTQHGLLDFETDGSFTYTPETDYTGDDTFTYTASDGSLPSGVTTVTIHVMANNPPDAVNDGYTTDEDTALAANAARNVLDNDTDPDVGDVLMVTGYDATGTTGGVTVNANGTFTYSPGSLFQYLAVGQQTTDTFTYTASDGRGGEDTATVTITITGVNDAPTAFADTSATDEDTVVSIDVVDNDTDPDTSDVLSVGTFQGTSTKGATITKNPDGTLKYDPTGSATLGALGEGEQTVDTFQYTVSDGHGGTHTATVSVTVTGIEVNVAPQLDNPIADMTLVDSSSPQPDSIDLTTVFSDQNGDDLTFTASSSNEELVTVEIVDGYKLQVTYLPYGHSQDRTPAVITVRATEDVATALWVEDTFTVTVEPQQPVDVYLVVCETATPAAEALATTLPTSVGSVAVGSNYVVEVWIQDEWDASVSGGPGPGLTGAEIDLHYNTALGDATVLNYEGATGGFSSDGSFGLGTIDDAAGLVDRFGNGKNGAGIAVTPTFVRVGYVTFTAETTGTQTFTLDQARAARFGLGYIDTTQISLGSATVNQVNDMSEYTFTIADSTMIVSGVINGAALVPPIGKEPANTAAGLSGTLQVVVNDLDHATTIQIQSGSIDVATNNGDGPFRPGVGGTNGADYGDFGLVAEASVSELIEVAIRDLVFDFSSNVLPVDGFVHFFAHQIQMDVASGFLDVLSPAMGSHRYDLTSLEAVPTDEEMGGLVETSPGVYEISFIYERTIDISGLSSSIQEGSYLTISGVLAAEYTTSGALTGTEGSEQDETGTGLYVTLSKDATTVAADGQVAAPPTSETWIDEWDSYWVEIWAKTDEASGVAAANVDLHYNAEYFTATQIDHGGTFVEGATGSIAQDGVVLGLGGGTSLATIGSGGYALVGRVKFESLGGDGVDLDFEDLVLGPHDLGFSLDNIAVDLVGVGAVDATIWQMPETELWAVPYDVDDDGEIALGDLSYFAASYGTDTIRAGTAMAAALDFDLDGEVGLGDLSYFASNYGLSRGGAGELTFPESFTRQWIGAGLDVEGDATVAEVLETAVANWQEALGLPQPIEIQLVVQDFNSAQLAEAVILEVDSTGIPTSGRVTLDDDANGLGWSTQLGGDTAEGLYDLYTVLLHEIGHTLGFMSSYEGFAEHVQTDGDGSVFVAAGISVDVDAAGNHVADPALAGDLMSATLDPGVRKVISTLDVQMLHAAYQTASSGSLGHGGEGAALTAASGSTDELAASAVSTAEFDAIDGRLEGDVTWDRLAGLHDGTSELGLTAEAVDWLHMAMVSTGDASLSGTRRSAARALGDEESSDGLLAEWATTGTSRQTEIDAADSLLADWEQWSV